MADNLKVSCPNTNCPKLISVRSASLLVIGDITVKMVRIESAYRNKKPLEPQLMSQIEAMGFGRSRNYLQKG
jgi:hypothetical protein